MPFIRIKKNWQVTVKTPHTFHLYVKEGFFNDTIQLYIDEDLVVEAKAGVSGWKGYTLFDVDGRTMELRWVWSLLTGNPVSILVMHKDRIIAQYGSDAAAKDDVLTD